MRKKTIGLKITNMKHFTIPTFILLKKMTAEFSDYHASCKSSTTKRRGYRGEVEREDGGIRVRGA